MKTSHVKVQKGVQEMQDILESLHFVKVHTFGFFSSESKHFPASFILERLE